MSGTLEFVSKRLTWLGPGVSRFLEKKMKAVPAIKKQIDKQYDGLTADLEKSLKPYKGNTEEFISLPTNGINREEILKKMQDLADREQDRWKDGFVSGSVYNGDAEHIEFLNKVYALTSQANPLHSDIWPSINKYEAEIISMTANMLGATNTTDKICGAVSSGGTESILLAMKSYRDRAREEKGITKPEMVLPVTAHAAFDKAAHYFNIKMVKVPLKDDLTVDIEKYRAAFTENTVVAIGSAPSFPHGLIDPIEELSEIARSKGVGFHTDGCLGGFILPWAAKLGYNVPKFDFTLPGVTSMSADTHKYGYAAKGTSVVLYRTEELRHYQYFTMADWPGGLYFSPTFAGSRAGALSAACWATMLSMGEDGYLRATKAILETASKIKQGIKEIDGIRLIGDPLFVIAFDSANLDVYRVLDQMAQKHWSINGLHKPSCLHIAITLRHTMPGVAERFIADLKESVEFVKTNPVSEGGMAPVYGMASSIPFRGMVSDLLKRYMDVLYKV
jgi:glutamate/tyrosine decarboxylase-like PLP-dependent enzyme